MPANQEASSESFFQQLMLVDELFEQSNTVVTYLESGESEIFSRANLVADGLEALSGATFFLGAATNSLKALKLLTFPGHVSAEPGVNNVANVTINGTAGLIRQALECCAQAKWMLDFETDLEFSQKGFAVRWANADEALKYSRSCQSSNLDFLERQMNNLIQEGVDRDLIVYWQNKPRPRKALEGASNILRGINLNVSAANDAQVQINQPFTNGEWMYRWLSALAHGYGWVHSENPSTQREVDSHIIWTRPDWHKLSLSLTLANQITLEVISILTDSH